MIDLNSMFGSATTTSNTSSGLSYPVSSYTTSTTTNNAYVVIPAGVTGTVTGRFSAGPAPTRWLPPEPIEMTPDEIQNQIGLYKGKMVKRMERFLGESRRIDAKVKQIFDKAEELGYKIESVKMWKNVNPRRRKTPPLTFQIIAKRGDMVLRGTMTIKPATIHFSLDRDNSYCDRMAVLSIKYFRTLCVKDNYLPVLVKAEPQDNIIRF